MSLTPKVKNVVLVHGAWADGSSWSKVTHLHLIWVSQIRFTQMAQESTRLDYLHEVEHMRERVLRLEQAIAEAVKLASPALQEVI